MWFHQLWNRLVQYRKRIQQEKQQREQRIQQEKQQREQRFNEWKQHLAESKRTMILREQRRKEEAEWAKKKQEKRSIAAEQKRAQMDRFMAIPAARRLDLDAAMVRLLRRHTVVDSFEELYSYISEYAGSDLSEDEYAYCKLWLYDKGLSGMHRYDDEREVYYRGHPPACNCADCTDRRLLKTRPNKYNKLTVSNGISWQGAFMLIVILSVIIAVIVYLTVFADTTS